MIKEGSGNQHSFERENGVRKRERDGRDREAGVCVCVGGGGGRQRQREVVTLHTIRYQAKDPSQP